MESIESVDFQRIPNNDNYGKPPKQIQRLQGGLLIYSPLNAKKSVEQGNNVIGIHIFVKVSDSNIIYKNPYPYQ